MSLDEYVIVGFTGTRRGMTVEQQTSVYDLLVMYSPREAHHGDCVGADAQFHEIARARDIDVVLHPPLDPKFRAWCRGAARVETELPYQRRNRKIMLASSLIVGAPNEAIEPAPARGQGTWTVIRRSRKAGKRVIVVWPDGTHD